MEREYLIQKIKETNSWLEFFKLKDEILEHLERNDIKVEILERGIKREKGEKSLNKMGGG